MRLPNRAADSRRGDSFGPTPLVDVDFGHHRWHAVARGAARRAALVVLLGAILSVLVGRSLAVRVSVDVHGELVPTRSWIVYAPHDGIIAELLVSPGDRVEAGQPLFRMRNDELRSSRLELSARLAAAEFGARQAGLRRDIALLERETLVVQAEARVREARAALRLLMADYSIEGDIDSLVAEHRPGSHIALDAAVSTIHSAVADLGVATARLTSSDLHSAVEEGAVEVQGLTAALADVDHRLASLLVTAPSDGVIETLDLLDRVGTRASAGTAIMEVVEEGWVARAYVSESDVHRIDVGDAVRVEIPALGSLFASGRARVEGQVAAVSLAPESGGEGRAGFYRVDVALLTSALHPPVMAGLRSGFRVSGQVVTDRQPVLPLVTAWLRRRVIGQ